MIMTRFIARIPGSPRLWLMLFLSFMLLFGFLEVAEDVFNDPKEGDFDAHKLDKSIAQFFQQFRTDRLTQIAIDITALGSVSILTVFSILAFGAILGKRDFLGVLHLGVALAGGFIWPLLLKDYFGRIRPDLVDHLVKVTDLSFPSGHAFGSTVTYVTFAFFGARYVRLWSAEVLCYLFAALTVAMIAMTRIYLGVHYATDVLAGMSAGGAWAFFVAAGFSILYQRERSQVT